MRKIRIAGGLLVTILILLVACAPVSLPPPALPVEVPPEEPAPPASAPVPPAEAASSKEAASTPYPTESSAPTPTVPKAPSNLTGDTVSQDSYTLYWTDNSDNEEGFRIYRNNSLVATVDINITSYQDTGLEPSATYRYAVKAYNQAGESQASTHTASMPNPPINVTLDYFGVKDAHGGNVQLVMIVSDSEGSEEGKHLFPPTEEGYQMGGYETKKIGQRVFHTPSVKGNLKINVLAYHRDQSKTEYLTLIKMMEWYYGDNINMLKQLVLNMPENDELIGYYENTWYPEENWGIGQYSAEGIENLRVWFSIWSDTEPESISKPSLLPDVRIQNADIPSQVKDSSGLWFHHWYDHTLTIENNEPVEIKIDWNVHSSNTGDFDSGSKTIPANSSESITESYYYETVGSREITYTIFYRGNELDSWSGTVNVVP